MKTYALFMLLAALVLAKKHKRSLKSKLKKAHKQFAYVAAPYAPAPSVHYAVQAMPVMEPYVVEHRVVEPVHLVQPEYARPKTHTTTMTQQVHTDQYTTYENEHRLIDSVDPYSGVVSTHEQLIQHPTVHRVDTLHNVEQHHIRHLDGSPIGQKVIAFHGLEMRKKK